MNTTVPPCLFIGIDNGFTGAIAALGPGQSLMFAPTAVIDLGREKLLDIDRNREVVRAFLGSYGLGKGQCFAVYEQCQPNPLFGARNNFENGKNGEFWRFLLSSEQIPFTLVNPKDWQKVVFRGIRGTDTKQMAELVRRQRFPQISLNGYTKSQIQGINDAIGIALWAAQVYPFLAQTSASLLNPKEQAHVTSATGTVVTM